MTDSQNENSSSAHWRSKVGGASAAGSAQQEEESIATVVLVRGENSAGAPQWAYALIPAERFMDFRMAEAQGEYNLADFGTVLHHGSGAEPPQEIRDEMARDYNCNPHFEEELEVLLQEALDELPDWQDH